MKAGVMRMKDENSWSGFRLLHEEVSSKDLFPHQPHQKVADSLVHLIENDEKGATVGIEGSWGGGKSTVVNLVRKALKGKAFFFIFDAWAHEENCLRRVFLESLIAELVRSIQTNDAKGDLSRLKQLQETIDGRFKTTKTYTTRQPTVTGILTVVFGFLSALGMSLMTMGVDAGDIKNKCLFAFGCVLTASPLLGILGWVFSHPKRILELFSVRFWSFLDSNSVDEVTQDVSDDPERSSVEFEKYFSEIMGLIYFYNPNVKIVIAVDNLDRIEGTKSLALWSTLQTFLQKRSEEVPECWFRKLWILVPYDAKGLESVWSTEDTNVGRINAKSFMDKAFQIRVEVPCPVMADWEDFAQANVDQLFNKEIFGDGEDIVRMLKVTRKALSNIPTPREIKNYVNQVAVFRKQFCEEIDTKTIAYYVIKRFVDVDRRSVEDIRSGLIAKTFPESQDLPYLSEDVAEQLSGILFDVSPKDGQQLLLEPQIADALENHKLDEFKEIIDNHEDGAWMAFDSYVRRPELWKDSSDIRKFLTTVACVCTCNYDTSRLRTFVDVCRDFVGRLCREVPVNLKPFFNPADDEVAVTASAISGLSGLMEARLLVRLNETLLSTIEVIVTDDEVDKFQLGKVADVILAAFKPESRTRREFKTFTAETLRQFCATLPNQKYDMAKCIVPMPSVVNGINSNIQEGAKIPPYLGRVVKYIIEAGLRIDWKATIDSVIKHVLFNNGQSADDVPNRRALDILLFIVGSSGDKYIKQIQPLLLSGAFYNFISVNPEERARKAMLLLACCNPKLCGDIHPASQVANSQSGIDAINAVLQSENEDDANKVLDLIEEFGIEANMRGFKSTTPNKIFGAMIQFSMQSAEYEWFNYDAENPLDSIWLYAENLNVSGIKDCEEKLYAYMDYCNSKFGVISVLNTIGLKNEDFNYCSNLIKYYLSKDFEALKGTVVECLGKLSETDYYLCLEVADFRGLLEFLYGQGCRQYLGLEYFKCLSRLLEGKGDDAKTREKFVTGLTQGSIEALARAMKPEYKGKLSEAVVNTLKAIETADVEKFVTYYSKLKGLVLIEDIPESLVYNMSWKGAVEDKPALLTIAAELIERNRHSNSVWLPSEETRDSMVEPLQKIAQAATDPNIMEAITAVARYYDVALIQPGADQSDESSDSPAGE